MKEKFKRLFDTKTTHGKIMRFLVVLVVLFLLVLAGFLFLRFTGLWEKVNSVKKIREIVERGGVFSRAIFVLFQILQTTILQIPAIFVTVAGSIVFGRFEAFIMSYLGVLVGSIIMFYIGRKAGRKFLNWIIGEETANKWIDRMSGGKYLFFLMMVFPCFPDDILCVIAGLTNMSFPFFMWTNIIARALGIGCTVFLADGAIIPFHGWGLVVWGIIVVFVAILFYLSIRFKDKIDEILNQIFKKAKDKANKSPNASNNLQGAGQSSKQTNKQEKDE